MVRLRAFGLMAFFYLVLPLAQVVDYVAAQPFSDALDGLNFAASILAYDWLLLTVLVGLKLPWFQATFPYDWRMRVHVVTTVFAAVFLTWHTVYYLVLKAKFIDLVTWSLMGVFVALVALSLLWIPLPGFRTARRTLLDRLGSGVLKSYDWLKGSHKLLFFTLAGLTYLHVLDAKLIGVASPLSSLAFQALFVVTAALFLWTRLRNLTLPSLSVRSLTTEGGIVRLVLGPHPRLKYRSGQFAFLRFPQPGLRGEEHPFSFTSAGHEDEVRFAVRALGDFTSRLSTLQPGDRVRVNGGFGGFHPKPGLQPLALIGSGIGAAPLVSILKDIAHQNHDREVVALLSVTQREELIDADALDELRDVMPNLRLRIFVFEEDGVLYGPEMLRRELGDAGRYRYFLCSSDKVRRIVVGALRNLGVKPKNIHFEAFTLG